MSIVGITTADNGTATRPASVEEDNYARLCDDPNGASTLSVGFINALIGHYRGVWSRAALTPTNAREADFADAIGDISGHSFASIAEAEAAYQAGWILADEEITLRGIESEGDAPRMSAIVRAAPPATTINGTETTPFPLGGRFQPQPVRGAYHALWWRILADDGVTDNYARIQQFSEFTARYGGVNFTPRVFDPASGLEHFVGYAGKKDAEGEWIVSDTDDEEAVWPSGTEPSGGVPNGYSGQVWDGGFYCNTFVGSSDGFHWPKSGFFFGTFRGRWSAANEKGFSPFELPNGTCDTAPRGSCILPNVAGISLSVGDSIMIASVDPILDDEGNPIELPEGNTSLAGEYADHAETGRVAKVDGTTVHLDWTLAWGLLGGGRLYKLPCRPADADPAKATEMPGSKETAGYFVDRFTLMNMRISHVDPLGPQGSQTLHVCAHDYLVSNCELQNSFQVFAGNPICNGLMERTRGRAGILPYELGYASSLNTVAASCSFETVNTAMVTDRATGVAQTGKEDRGARNKWLAKTTYARTTLNAANPNGDIANAVLLSGYGDTCDDAELDGGIKRIVVGVTNNFQTCRNTKLWGGTDKAVSMRGTHGCDVSGNWISPAARTRGSIDAREATAGTCLGNRVGDGSHASHGVMISRTDYEARNVAIDATAGAIAANTPENENRTSGAVVSGAETVLKALPAFKAEALNETTTIRATMRGLIGGGQGDGVKQIYVRSGADEFRPDPASTDLIPDGVTGAVKVEITVNQVEATIKSWQIEIAVGTQVYFYEGETSNPNTGSNLFELVAETSDGTILHDNARIWIASAPIITT